MSAAVSDWSDLVREQPSLKVVTVSLGWSKGERMGIISDFLWELGFSVMRRMIARRAFSLVWISLDERLTVVEENYSICSKAKGPFVKGKCLVIQRDFQREDEQFQEQHRDGSGGETARDYYASTSVKNFQIFFQCIKLSRKGNNSEKAYERTNRMIASYSWERVFLEGLHDAEAMERSALKWGKNFLRR